MQTAAQRGGAGVSDWGSSYRSRQVPLTLVQMP